MNNMLKLLAFVVLFSGISFGATAADSRVPLKDLPHGSDKAPITVYEYASFTCSHCADFYQHMMPEIEKNYVETGKVRFFFYDFPSDGYGLKAAALTQCMPDSQYYSFVKLVFSNYDSWTHASDPIKTLTQYAEMAGLPAEKAEACLKDTDLMEKLAKRRSKASADYSISATPTFLIRYTGEDKNQDVLVGAQPYEKFAAIFDRLLAQKKK